MIRNREKANDLLASFRKSRNQVQQGDFQRKTKPAPKQKTHRGYGEGKKSVEDIFKSKYADLENTIKSFSTIDLVFYFKEKADEAGIKYVIANKSRDCGIMKKLLANYSILDICLMIEFLFSKEQEYLEKEGLQPTILISGWCNKLYHDSISWANDEYRPKKTKMQASNERREWKKTGSNEIKIGEW